MKQPNGVILYESHFSVRETIDRIEDFLKKHGATIYARIDQQAELEKAGLHMLPLEFILFGNPKAGGPMMIENPIVALDLPLKIIAWEDDQKQIFIAYNEAGYIEERYGLTHHADSPLNLGALIETVLKG